MSSLLSKAYYLPLALTVGYFVILGALTIPVVQREFVFLQHVKLPFLEHYDEPESYGLAPFKTRNFKLRTADGETLGTWHILPHSVYRNLTDEFPPSSPISLESFENALLLRPTIIYFHGNAATRAAPHRIRSYTAFTTRLDCNVIAIDYRGFGDSSGVPSEEGLLIDARTVWDYVVESIKTSRSSSTSATSLDHLKPEEMVILAGQSLGTGVVSGLAGKLADEGIAPRALVVIAPYTSIRDMLDGLRLLSFLPILSPLNSIPGAHAYFKSFLKYPFDSKSALARTTSSILILHSKNDGTIPVSHSADLFASLQLPSSAITTKKYKGWGTVRSFDRAEKGSVRKEVVWWEGDYGGHNHLGWAEGSIDLISRIGRLDVT